MQDDVRNRIVIKLTEGFVLGQLDTPGAHRARAFKRKITLVFKIKLEHAAVILPGTGGDGFDADRIISKTHIAVIVFGIAAGQIGVDSNFVSEQA
jgi:hypothetical protein